jgi:hypothetical protein
MLMTWLSWEIMMFISLIWRNFGSINLKWRTWENFVTSLALKWSIPQKRYGYYKRNMLWTCCKPILIMLLKNMKLSANASELVENTIVYKLIIKNLIYITITRLNLNYTIGVVNQFMQTPQKSHLDVVRHILKYMKHTM